MAGRPGFELTSVFDRPQIRLGEILGALSYALDVAEGQAAGHALRSCVIGMTIAERLGLGAERRSELYYALLLKEQLRQIYRVPAEHAIALLDAWIQWARRCRLRPFVKLAHTLTEQRPGIQAAIEHDLSNARVEAINTKIRLITRRAFGFHSPHALIALAMLTLGGLCPPLPGRLT